MAEGLVTFFKYEQLGFFKRNNNGEEYSEPLTMGAMLENLKEWYETRSSLTDTLLWNDETLGYQHRKKVYLKSIERNDDTGDYIIILWRAVGSGDGVYGIPADARLDDQRLYNANDAADGNEVIWGEPAYYWFIPRMNVFASIKFPQSIADTKLLNNYFNDFIKLHSTLKERTVVEKERENGSKFLSVSFQSEETQSNLWFRINSKQYRKLTGEADLERMSQDITHLVRREEIAAIDIQHEGWERLFHGLPFVSSTTTRQTRKVEVVIEAKPTVDELREMLDTYHDNYAGGIDPWVNIGFKKEGVGGTVWLNEYVLKNYLTVSELGQGDASTGHYSPTRLFNALHLTRDGLLAPIGRVEPENAAA